MHGCMCHCALPVHPAGGDGGGLDWRLAVGGRRLVVVGVAGVGGGDVVDVGVVVVVGVVDVVVVVVVVGGGGGCGGAGGDVAYD